MDLIDLADPIRLLILLLPERYRGPAAALITALVAAQGIAASIVSRLPLAAAQDPRWGRVVRALHWYSLLRFRDEKGTTKAIGAELAPRVTVAPTIALPAEKQGALVVSETRPSDPPDEDAHASIVPPPPFDPHRTQRGSVDVRSMLAVVVAVVCVAGCPVVREAAMRAAPGVPDPVDCAPGVQRCDGNAPVVCSATHREWPALPRRASGEPRTCAPGVCVLDGGVAYCDLSARDGGAE